jgi:hypothetical protein
VPVGRRREGGAGRCSGGERQAAPVGCIDPGRCGVEELGEGCMCEN